MISAIFAAKKNQLMRFFPVFFCLLFLVQFGCQAQRTPEVPPTDASLKDLRWQLNNLLTLQLPSTYPDSVNGVVYKKTYSANFNRADSSLLEIPELRRAVATDSIFGSNKYLLKFGDIDVEQVRIVTSPDGKFSAILIPAKPGKSFRLSLFSNEGERQVETVTIGWYDHVQDRTLDRAHTAWVQFLRKLTTPK